MPRIALIPGDGIGVEVTREARRVLERVADAEGLDLPVEELGYGAERYLSEGVAITDEEFRALSEDFDARYAWMYDYLGYEQPVEA